MGYYTWKLANKNNTVSAGYYRKLYVLCPDDSFIAEPFYDGYGEFDGHNIFELVVDWNRPYLKDIFAKLQGEADAKGEAVWGMQYAEVAIAAMESDASAAAKAKEIFKSETDIEEWKRIVGIAIACENNSELPFPIKIVNHMQNGGKRLKYADLPASMQTQ